VTADGGDGASAAALELACCTCADSGQPMQGELPAAIVVICRDVERWRS
jgi:hypothetical protein